MNSSIFFERAFRLINLYNSKTKQPRTYSTGHTLYSAEVHTIEIIGSRQGITATELAKVLCVTKGAVSQTVSKLTEKDLVTKRLDNSGKILLCLTESGVCVCEEHRRLHEKMHSRLSELTSELPPEASELFSQIADALEDELEKI